MYYYELIHTGGGLGFSSSEGIDLSDNYEVNSKYLLNLMIESLDLEISDLRELKPNELKALVREKKINKILNDD